MPRICALYAARHDLACGSGHARSLPVACLATAASASLRLVRRARHVHRDLGCYPDHACHGDADCRLVDPGGDALAVMTSAVIARMRRHCWSRRTALPPAYFAA